MALVSILRNPIPNSLSWCVCACMRVTEDGPTLSSMGSCPTEGENGPSEGAGMEGDSYLRFPFFQVQGNCLPNIPAFDNIFTRLE